MSVDARVAELATRQHGQVSAAQCLALGLTRGQVRHRATSGAWHRVHAGVYAVGHTAMTAHGRYAAAVLAGGPHAVLSHRSAASLWGLQPHHRAPPHVLIPVKRRRRAGIVVHWTRSLPATDRTVRHGVPTTTLARTLVDLADIAGAKELEEAIRAAERIHGFDRAWLRPVNGRSGTPRLLGPRRVVRSHLEPRFLRLLSEAGFAPPETNVPIGPYVVDVLWREAGIAVEVDDWDTHRHRGAFAADRVRDRLLTARGLRPVRVTADDLTDGRKALVTQLVALGAPRLG